MICQQFTVDRIQDGQPVTRPLMVAYDQRTGALAIWQTYRPTKGLWADRAYYELEEFYVDRGRAFWLHRQPEDVEADPQAVSKYAVYLGEPYAECDCKGKYASERRGQACKHVDALAWLLANGHLRRREMFGGIGA